MTAPKSLVAERRILYDVSSSSEYLTPLAQFQFEREVNELVDVFILIIVIPSIRHLFVVVVSPSIVLR